MSNGEVPEKLNPWQVRMVRFNRVLTSPWGMIGTLLVVALLVTIYFTFLNNGILYRLDEKTNEIIENDRKSAKVLCNFIVGHDIRGDLDLTDPLRREIEELCDQQINPMDDQAPATSGSVQAQPSQEPNVIFQPIPIPLMPAPQSQPPPAENDGPSDEADQSADMPLRTLVCGAPLLRLFVGSCG